MNLSFDQYQRFQPVASLFKSLKRELPSKWKVLDIGGYPGLLQEFIPPSGKYFYSDVITPEKTDKRFIPLSSNGKVQAPDSSFDFVISIDTLEHLPENKRFMLLEESLRLASSAIIYVTPVYSKTAAQFENFLNDLYLRKGIVHNFLSEHILYKLPQPEFIPEWFRNKDLEIFSHPLNNLDMWFHYMLLRYIGSTQLNDEYFQNKLDELFIQNAKLFDNNVEPAYRQLFFIPIQKKYCPNLDKLFHSPKPVKTPSNTTPLLFMEERFQKWDKTTALEPVLGFAQLKATQTFGELLPPNKIQLQFECLFPQLTGISIFIATFDRNELEGSLILRLSQHKTTYYETSFSLKGLKDNSFLEWKFSPLIHSQNETFDLEIIPWDTPPGKSITLWFHDEDISGFTLKINDNPVQGTLSMKLFYIPLKQGETQFFAFEKNYKNLQTQIQKLENDKETVLQTNEQKIQVLEKNISSLQNEVQLKNQEYENFQTEIRELENEKANVLQTKDKNIQLLEGKISTMEKALQQKIQEQENLLSRLQKILFEYAKQFDIPLSETDEPVALLQSLLLDCSNKEELIQTLQHNNQFSNSMCNSLLKGLEKQHKSFIRDASNLKKKIIRDFKSPQNN